MCLRLKQRVAKSPNCEPTQANKHNLNTITHHQNDLLFLQSPRRPQLVSACSTMVDPFYLSMFQLGSTCSTMVDRLSQHVSACLSVVSLCSALVSACRTHYKTSTCLSMFHVVTALSHYGQQVVSACFMLSQRCLAMVSTLSKHVSLSSQLVSCMVSTCLSMSRVRLNLPRGGGDTLPQL